MKRAIIIVLDSVGMGELPDADQYGDVGSDTLGNIAAAVKGFCLKNLQQLGLGNIDSMKGYPADDEPTGCYGRMVEQSFGKDTTTGHWEMAGIVLEKPFPTFPKGFPKDFIQAFEDKIQMKTLGNVVASGTEIIQKLGEEHVKTGFPIIYTSADSVFQVAAHESVISIPRLYEICQIARDMLQGEIGVGRVIARPFEGEIGSFKRTDRRHDFSLNPIRKTILDELKESGVEVKGVGKIEDIFNKQGITAAVHIHNNMDGVNQTLTYMQEAFKGLIFTNLVDFDMLYGHRNDVTGYANALKAFDDRIPEILGALKEEDLLIITADHGCDPTTASTDHSREYVPLLVHGKKLKKNINLGTRSTFSDIAVTLAEFFEITTNLPGKSFLKEVMR